MDSTNDRGSSSFTIQRVRERVSCMVKKENEAKVRHDEHV